jgi:hypothetical protein
MARIRGKNRRMISQLLSLALVSASPAGGRAPDPALVQGPGVDIANRGRHSIYNLYAAPSGRQGWGRDRFDDATIPAGRSRSVAIPHRPGRCHYRLKLVLADRSTRIRRVDICRGGLWIVTDGGDAFEPRSAAP